MKGIIASPGRAYADAFIVQEPRIVVEKTSIDDSDNELERLQSAIDACDVQFESLIKGLDADDDTATIELLEFQQMMLEDTDFLDKITTIITEDKLNAEYAVEVASNDYIGFLQNLTDNDYLRERAADIGDMAQRLLGALLGISRAIEEPDHGYIAIANDITPSRMAELDQDKLKGIALEKGSLTSHCSILAASLGIPCLIEVTGLLEADTTGKRILLDAEHGELVLDPSKQQIDAYLDYRKAREQDLEALKAYVDKESRTLDGAHMGVYANIISASEVASLLEQGGEGVGLLRTELIYMEETTAAPSEEKQFQLYSEIASALDGLPLIIRTLDVGGDKDIDYLHIGKEDNPFLGYRAIRYSLDTPEVFKAQIKAIVRASAQGNVEMMFPLITTIDEIRRAKALVSEVFNELDKGNVAYNKDMKIGIMIETPAAAFDSARMAREVDFFSIGTNDLAQYLFAADRTNAKVLELNSYFQPTLLRTMAQVADSAHEAGIVVDICGRAGEVLELIPLWIAMGIDNVSVSIPEITRVRRKITQTDKAASVKLLDKVLQCDTAGEVQAMLGGAA